MSDGVTTPTATSDGAAAEAVRAGSALAAGPWAVEPGAGGVAEQVYQALFRMVMQSDIAPGSRMVIDKIAADLGVSSTPVREALARLETQGLVTKERLRGFFAAEVMGAVEFADLWEFRQVLEPYAARQAAIRIDRTGKVRLQHEIDTIRHVRLQDDYASQTAFREHDQRVHDLIFEAAGNAHLRKAMDRTHVHNRMMRIRFVPIDGYHAIQEHDDVAKAIIAGDADGAEAAMRDHIERAFERIRDFLP